VPVEYRNVAPDGASYILNNDISVGNDFYLVDVNTGARKFVLSGDGPPAARGSWTVVEYASEGVYFWSTGIATVPGLWLLDLTKDTIRLIDGSHYWGMVAGKSAWAEDPPFGGQGSTYKIYRLDLASGQVTTWYETSTPIRLLSPTPDGDVLITYGEYGSAKLELVAEPNQLVPVDVPPGFPFVTDAYLAHPGVWIPLQSGGVALYVNRQARIMAASPGIFNVAGGCW
jgi:hypothetical protein